MGYDEVLDKVTGLLAETVEDGETEITPDSRLLNDLGLESLEIYSVFGELEQAYGLHLPDSLLRSMVRVEDIVQAALHAAEKQSRA